MSRLKITDIYGTEISLDFSSSGYIRFDFINEKAFPEREHSNMPGTKVPNCFSFTEEQAKLIHLMLGEMLKEE